MEVCLPRNVCSRGVPTHFMRSLISRLFSFSLLIPLLHLFHSPSLSALILLLIGNRLLLAQSLTTVVLDYIMTMNF